MLRRFLSALVVAALLGGTTACAPQAGAAGSGEDSAATAPDLATAADVPTPADAPLPADVTLAADATAAAATDAGPTDAVADATPTATDTADTVDTATEEAQPGVCFPSGPPAADAFVADVPAPNDKCDYPKPIFFEGEPLPAPTLQIEPGYGDADGNFIPYADGDWAPIIHGQQGCIHVNAGFRVDLPGKTDAKLTLQSRGTAWIGCGEVAVDQSPKVSVVQAPGPGHVYTNVQPSKAGQFVQFGSCNSALWCGQWIKLRIQVRLPGTSQWGQVERTLRLYDTLAPSK